MADASSALRPGASTPHYGTQLWSPPSSWISTTSTPFELSRELYWLARLRLLGRRSVHLVQGDSSDELRTILERIDTPSVFWLDGHYGGGHMARGKKDAPIVEELSAILAHRVRDHVIVIDDVGIFQRAEGDTLSLAELERQIRASRPASEFVVEDNMIRVALA